MFLIRSIKEMVLESQVAQVKTKKAVDPMQFCKLKFASLMFRRGYFLSLTLQETKEEMILMGMISKLE